MKSVYKVIWMEKNQFEHPGTIRVEKFFETREAGQEYLEGLKAKGIPVNGTGDVREYPVFKGVM